MGDKDIKHQTSQHGTNTTVCAADYETADYETAHHSQRKHSTESRNTETLRVVGTTL